LPLGRGKQVQEGTTLFNKVTSGFDQNKALKKVLLKERKAVLGELELAARR
jgi:hypothetical protein